MSSAEPDQGRQRVGDPRGDATRKLLESLGESERFEAISALLADFGEAVREEVLEYLRAARAAEQVTDQLAGEPARVLGSADLLESARLDGEVQRQLFAGELLDAEAVASQLGSTSANRQRAAKLRKEGKLVGLRRNNRYLYPAFQFDRGRQCIYPAAEEINARLDAANDPWGVASWWLRPRDVLGGRAPRDLLGTERESELRTLVDAELSPLG